MDDLISRQAAIDAVSKGCQELRGVFGRCEENLLDLPSAQRWIPCSERLPDESKWYLISNGLDSWVAIWSKENKEWLSVTGLDYTITDVVAWMEFPEAYREDGAT